MSTALWVFFTQPIALGVHAQNLSLQKLFHDTLIVRLVNTIIEHFQHWGMVMKCVSYNLQ